MLRSMKMTSSEMTVMMVKLPRKPPQLQRQEQTRRRRRSR